MSLCLSVVRVLSPCLVVVHPAHLAGWDVLDPSFIFAVALVHRRLVRPWYHRHVLGPLYSLRLWLVLARVCYVAPDPGLVRDCCDHPVVAVVRAILYVDVPNHLVSGLQSSPAVR